MSKAGELYFYVINHKTMGLQIKDCFQINFSIFTVLSLIFISVEFEYSV